MNPIAFDIYCGLGGWTEGLQGLQAEGYRVIGITQPRRKSKTGSWDTTRANFNPDKTWDEGQKQTKFVPNRGWTASTAIALGLESYHGTRIAGQQAEGVKVESENGRRTDPGKGARFTTRDCGTEGVKTGHWFGDGGSYSPMAMMGSKSNARKAASATIAKIPLALAQWVAKVYYPKHLIISPTPHKQTP